MKMPFWYRVDVGNAVSGQYNNAKLNMPFWYHFHHVDISILMLAQCSGWRRIGMDQMQFCELADILFRWKLFECE